MISMCATCARDLYVSVLGKGTKDEKKVELCGGCHKQVELCLCEPIPILTVAFDVFVDYAWMEKDESATINGLPQLPYTVGALCEEAGEAFGKVKKLYRDDSGQMTDERRDAILTELSDAAFYITKAAHLLGSGLAQVLEMSKAKNVRRIAEGTQHGSGDDR